MFAESSFLIGAIILLLGVSLDKVLGEPRRFHPLIGFGNWANWLEKQCRRLNWLSERQQGIVAWCLAVIPAVLGCYLLVKVLLIKCFWLWFCVNAFMLYLTLGGKSLVQHADNIYCPLQQGDLEGARQQVAMIVSRNTDKMTETEIVSSAVESVLENGNDAVFAPMIWFLLLGAPGAVLLRLTNTLDAMWGYKNAKYLQFGYLSAKSDDLLGWLPARITALFYALQGDARCGLRCWSTQAKDCKSPNGGVAMSTGAGALGVKIGGPTYYDGVLIDKKPMGVDLPATAETIPRANRLVSRGAFLLAGLTLVIALFWELF